MSRTNVTSVGSTFNTMVRKRYRLSSLTGIYVLKNLYLLFYRDFVNERSTKLTESYQNIAVYVTERPDRHPRIIANYCKFMHPNFLLRQTTKVYHPEVNLGQQFGHAFQVFLNLFF